MNSNNPSFKTPDPSELQSQESKAATRELLEKEQGGETEAIEFPNSEVSDKSDKSNKIDAESIVGDSDEFSKRQTGPMNRTGG